MIKDFHRNNEPVLSAAGDYLQFEILKRPNHDSLPDSQTRSEFAKDTSPSRLGLLPMKYEVRDSTVQYSYFIPPCVKLSDYFSETTVDSDTAYKILKNITDILVQLKRKSSNILIPKNCVVNSRYIYINEKSKAIYFIYIPFKHAYEEINFGQYIHDLVSIINFSDREFLSQTAAFREERKQFSVEEFSLFLTPPPPPPGPVDPPEHKTPEPPPYVPPPPPQPKPQPPPPPPPPVAKKPCLIDPTGTGMRKYPIASMPFSIGRRDDQRLRIDLPGISREHVVITSENNQYFIEDLSSSGATLDGFRLPKGVKCKINDNSEIALIYFDRATSSFKEINLVFRLE